MRHQPLGRVFLATLAVSLAGVGCEGMGGGNKGKVQSQDQTETVRPDGTAVRQRTQTRQTASGTVVKETETQEREVVKPGPGVSNPDATKKDPGQQ